MALQPVYSNNTTLTGADGDIVYLHGIFISRRDMGFDSMAATRPPIGMRGIALGQPVCGTVQCYASDGREIRSATGKFAA
jgi:hypothetical protein